MKITNSTPTKYASDDSRLMEGTLVLRVGDGCVAGISDYYIVGAVYITNLRNGATLARDSLLAADRRFVIVDYSITISN